MKASSLSMWSSCLDPRDMKSSVSSGRFTGSSGGHESCALFHGPWKERPPLVLAPQRQPRKSNPRLEQLKDKIRAQAQWQASCASLGTSVPSSASCLYKTSSTMLRQKTLKVASSPPVTTCPGSGILHAAEHRSKDRASFRLGQELSRIPQCHNSDSELAGVYAWRKGQALVRRLLGPPPALSWLQSKAPATDLGSDKKAAIVGDSPAHTWLSKPTCTHSDHQVSDHTPSLAFHGQSASIQGAMEILQNLRHQIQAGLELARHSRVARKFSSSKPRQQNLAGKRQQGPQSTWDMQGSFSKSAWTATERKCSSLDRAGNLHSQKHWKKAMAERESCPQRAWTAQGKDTFFQRPGSTPEKSSPFSQRPWSAMGWQTCPQRAWEAQGHDTSFQRSESPPKKPSPFSQRPWSALAGQACSQWNSTACKDWEVPGSSPWSSSVAKPHPALHQPWSSSCVQKSSPYSKGKSAVPPPSKAKPAWLEPAQAFSQSKLAKEQDTQGTPPCPRPRQSLGRAHKSESLRDFMRQKAQARRKQAMEQKALATHALELRNQRLQEVYRKQREAVLGKAVPVVSQRRPGIVTFVPSSIQSWGLEAPESLRPPERKWSKVTSGTVLGDQEAPDSFCLCLNKPWNRAETRDTGRPRDGVSGAPLLPSTASSPDPKKLQDMSGRQCVYMDPKDTEHLGPSGLLHFQYKQARLQALETMAKVLKQRIDILTTKLHKSTSSDTAGDLASDMLSLSPSTAPVTPTFTPPSYPRSLVSDESRETSQDWVDMQAKPLPPSTYFQDGEMLSWRPNWEPQSLNLGTHIESQPQGAIEDRHRELKKKLQREMATLQDLGACMRRLQGYDKTSVVHVPITPATLTKRDIVFDIDQIKGQQEPKGPHSGGLHEGHLTNFQLKSLSFLESLKLDQQKQELALALLRQRAEHEVWETQMTLDELLFKHQLKQEMEKRAAQQKPEKASRLGQQQMCGGLEPSTLSPNTMTTRSRSTPSPQRDSTGSLKHPEKARALSAGPNQGLLSLSEPVQQDPACSQLTLADFYPSDRPSYKMLEQSLRDEELRAQHQTAVLRLRELALEEKAGAELAFLEHQIGCLGLVGREAAQATLREKQQQALSRLSKERREIQHLKKVYLSLHHGRKQLLQHQQSVLKVQRSVAHLRQELQARTQLLQVIKKDDSLDSQLKPQEAKELPPPAGSSSGLSSSSLQEFQRATATLVQLSSSSSSLSNVEAEDTLRADPSWSRELSAHDSWEEPGLPSFWGLHQGLPQLEGVRGDVGQVTLKRLEDSGARLLSGFSEEAAVAPVSESGARLLSGFSEEAAVAPGSESGYNFLQAGWPLSFSHVPSPRLGSELSESSSQIWDENNEENLEEPSPCVEPPSGSSLPANGSLDMEGSGRPHTTLPSLGPGEEQDASRSSRSVTDTLNTGKARQMSPVTTFTMFPHQIPSTSDSTLLLSFHLDTPSSERAGLSKGNIPTAASAGYQEEPQDVDTSPSIERKPLQALPDPKAPVTLKAPSEDRAPLVTEVARPSYVDGFLTEILSPVDEELSYGSGDLPSSIHRDTHLPPPPPTPQAKSDTNETSPSSEDFPSPPEEAMFPGDLLDTLEEDLSITAEDMSSLSEGALEEALSLGPQDSQHCLGASGQDGNLDDSSSISPLSNWVVSAPETSPRLSTQPLSPSSVAYVARENPKEAPGSQSAEQGIEQLLDRRAAMSSPSRSAPSESPPPDPVPSVAESLKHTSKKEGQSCWTEDQHKLQGLLDRQLLCRRNWTFDPASGACADFSGTGDAGPVDLVSTQLSRRILCDSLAALSGLAPEDRP
ncbi:coiled-coil domain-containing protein 187 isoform X1 [Cricetulus griseus]|uniref:coiled-coil domain-containing protein 187 isoform X1 n=1 Tax=Cricetulus griseus TaxID=10029 RepID=UPI0015C35794|nr:coiled-coil domain-containing protein 187 isoform X1 [Cricetulus griseus]